MTSNQPASEDREPDDDVTLPPAASLPGEDATLPPSGSTETDTALSVGDKVRYFGDYELLDEIARGGMGVVYRAQQINLNRIVALKMILAGQFAGDEDVQRFHTEAEAAANLDHPGIVPIFEIGEHAGQHYFSMGFVQGESLAQKVAEGPLAPREAAELVKMVCDAMAYAHDRGVIHRDLKPANILIDANGQPKVTDFGLAKKSDTDSNLTGTGQILGTPAYMPPEQASGQTDVGPLADIYSLGAILYCLLTGRPPFQAASPMDTLLQVLDKEPVAPRVLNPAIPRDLETVCLKCLRKESKNRYASAKDVGAELGRFMKGEPIHARPVSIPEKAWRWCRRNPAISSLIAALVLAMVSGTLISTVFGMHAQAIANYATEQRVVSALRSEVELYLAYGDMPSAEDVLQTMLEDYPNEVQTKDALFTVAMQIDDDRKADAYLEEHFAGAVMDAETYTMMGLRYTKENRPEKAGEYYRKALAVDPDQCGATFELGKDAVKAGSYEQAITYLDKVYQTCKEKGYEESCLELRLKTLVALGRLDDAEADLQRLLEEFPQSPSILDALLSVAFRIDDAARTEQYFQQAVNQSENPALVYATIGDRYRREGMQADATRYYRKALNVNPEHCGAAFALGRDALADARYEEALEYLDLACQLCSHPGPLQLRIEAHLALGRLAAAEADVELLISKFPEDPDTLRTVLKVAEMKSNKKSSN